MPWLLVLPFVLLWLSAWAGLHVYLWRRLVRDPDLPQPWRRIATGAIAGLGSAIPLAELTARVIRSEAALFFAWPAYLWMGFAIYALLVLLLIEGGRILARRWRRWRGGERAVDPERRQLLARATASAAVAVATTTIGVGILRARAGVTTREVRINLDRLPVELDGFTIVQLSDIHAGNTIGAGYVAELVERANRARPDLVAVTGDIADGDPAALREVVAPLGELAGRHGVFYSTGNHDYFAGVDGWIAELERLGMRILHNQRVAIDEGGVGFDLAGIDDHDAGRFSADHGADLAAAVAGRDPARELVLLAHQPRQVADAARHGVGLQLSGHTHGGQVWPFHLAVMIQQGGYLHGHYRHRGTQLYVSRGSGYWGPPIRVLAPPEITRVILRARPG